MGPDGKQPGERAMSGTVTVSGGTLALANNTALLVGDNVTNNATLAITPRIPASLIPTNTAQSLGSISGSQVSPTATTMRRPVSRPRRGIRPSVRWARYSGSTVTSE